MMIQIIQNILAHRFKAHIIRMETPSVISQIDGVNRVMLRKLFRQGREIIRLTEKTMKN